MKLTEEQIRAEADRQFIAGNIMYEHSFIIGAKWALSKDDKSEKLKEYEIDFDGHLKCVIQITDNVPTVLKAMNGWGDSIPVEDVKLNAIIEKP